LERIGEGWEHVGEDWERVGEGWEHVGDDIEHHGLRREACWSIQGMSGNMLQMASSNFKKVCQTAITIWLWLSNPTG
jgi:hypothetical protein